MLQSGDHYGNDYGGGNDEYHHRSSHADATAITTFGQVKDATATQTQQHRNRVNIISSRPGSKESEYYLSESTDIETDIERDPHQDHDYNSYKGTMASYKRSGTAGTAAGVETDDDVQSVISIGNYSDYSEVMGPNLDRESMMSRGSLATPQVKF